MKTKEFKELLKKKAQNLKEIKIGLKEAQRVYYFNSFGLDGRHVSEYSWHEYQTNMTDEIRRRRKNAWDGLYKCLNSYEAAKKDFRARHIAYSLFRGRKPEQIESNYQGGNWEHIQADIDKWLNLLLEHNPPKTYYHEFVEESKEQYEKYFKEVI